MRRRAIERREGAAAKLTLMVDEGLVEPSFRVTVKGSDSFDRRRAIRIKRCFRESKEARKFFEE